MSKLLPTSSSPSAQEFSLRLPANKRLATPVSHRLNSIIDPSSTTTRAPSITKPFPADREGASTAADGAEADATPRRRSLASIRLPLPFPRRESGNSRITNPAPPYDWVPEPIEEGLDGRVPVEGEKLRHLRREDDEGKTMLWWRRKRAIVLAVIFIMVVAFVVGLGVGLSKQPRSKNATSAGNRTAPPLEFPLGEWTVNAKLVEAQTGCTSNPDIWRCYPYAIGGETMFDLTIANTSASYAPNNTASLVDSTGWSVYDSPANLVISSSNPFAIPFMNQSMTHHDFYLDRAAARLQWTFEMTKSVMPASSVMEGGQAAECVFPQTMFKGMLYLKALRGETEGQVQVDNGKEWPYAVEIRQDKDGGGAAIECQGMGGGSTMSVPSADGVCDCVYRNY